MSTNGGYGYRVQGGHTNATLGLYTFSGNTLGGAAAFADATGAPWLAVTGGGGSLWFGPLGLLGTIW
jgi:hypothetical protein